MKPIAYSIIGIGIMFVMLSYVAIADVSGKNGTTFSSDGSGMVAWSNPGNAQTSNNVYATATATADGDITDYLIAKGFGFSIPSGATIDGIEVRVERKSSHSSLSVAYTVDQSVRLTKDGSTFVGSDKADFGTLWPTSDTFKTYGTSSDKWGTTWTDTNINSANFGVGISASFGLFTATSTGSIDYINITVYYTPSAGSPCDPPAINSNWSIPCGCNITRKAATVDWLSTTNFHFHI